MNAEASRAHAHLLIDRLPHSELPTAARFLEFLLLSPVDRALATAPVDDEPISEEEQKVIAHSQEWFANNEGIPFENVVAELGLTIEQLRNYRDDR